ncbi:hypothetical protein HPG69_001491 [Diceros bicornis minor]|uniref:Uncharacterized protein n=1 Tax=Diceros bicornis minor TaxID=77932 RepID=A0A7J7FFQ7_DICBM|nr:hypothetical protein HPG69_001491 [Diceros bicornis minor]
MNKSSNKKKIRVLYQTKESKIHEGIQVDSYLLITKTTPNKLVMLSMKIGTGEDESYSDQDENQDGCSAFEKKTAQKGKASLPDCCGPFPRQLIATMKVVCCYALQVKPQRLMAVLYICGKQPQLMFLVRSTLSRQRERVECFKKKMKEEKDVLIIKALLPIAERLSSLMKSGRSQLTIAIEPWEIILSVLGANHWGEVLAFWGKG